MSGERKKKVERRVRGSTTEVRRSLVTRRMRRAGGGQKTGNRLLIPP